MTFSAIKFMMTAPKVMQMQNFKFLVAMVDYSLGLKNIAKKEGSHHILVIENLPELLTPQITLK